MNYRIIERAFKKGDIKISALKHIERKLGIKVEWVWDVRSSESRWHSCTRILLSVISRFR